MKKVQEKIMQEDLMDKISVIIRNHNESEFIGFAIQSCLDHFNKPEIIVVNNKSTDDSVDIVKLFNFENIKILNIDDYSPGKALNCGVKNAKNNIVLILSAHAEITKMNFNYIQKQLEHNVAVFGNQIPIYRGKKITKRYIWSHFINKEVINMYSIIENRHFLHNAFCFYRKEKLIDYPFDEKLSGKEDRYWAKDIVEKGYSCLYTPEIECNHFWTSNGATWKGLA